MDGVFFSFFFFFSRSKYISEQRLSGTKGLYYCDDSDLQTLKSPETTYMLKARSSTCGAIGRWWDLYEVWSIGRNLGDCYMSMKEMLSKTPDHTMLAPHLLSYPDRHDHIRPASSLIYPLPDTLGFTGSKQQVQLTRGPQVWNCVPK